MSTTNKLELVQMLRLRPDKNITRSKMYIRLPNGGYMKRVNPKTGEEEYYTLKRLLLDIKYKAIHSYKGIESSFNEYLIRIVFNHEIVLKSALKSVRDPGHEEVINAIHGYLSKNHSSSLHNTSSLPLKSKIMEDFLVILKKNYHKTTYFDDNDTYIKEDILIRDNDIQLDDINDVDIEYDSIFSINSAINFYSRMKKIYVDLRDVLLSYQGSDIIFNKYTVTGRDGGKGKMNSLEEEESKILIKTIQSLEVDYLDYLSKFESRAKEIMKQIHIRLKTKEQETKWKKQFLHGVMLSLGENIKILDHYIKIFFNEINLLSQGVRDAIRRQNQKKVSPKGYGPRASPTFSSISSGKPKAKKEEDDFYKGMNMMSLSPTNEDEKKPPAVPVADIKRLSPPTTNKTRKKKKKKKKKNKTKKSGKTEDFDDLIAQAKAADLDTRVEETNRGELLRNQFNALINERAENNLRTVGDALKRLYGIEDISPHFKPGYIGNYFFSADFLTSKKVVPEGIGYMSYPKRNKAGLDNYIGSWSQGKVHGFGQLTYNYKNNSKNPKKLVYKGNFHNNRRYGEGSIYTFDDKKLLREGLFLEEEGAWDKLSTLDNERIHFIPQQTWSILRKYYWLLRLFYGNEKLFLNTNPYDMLNTIQREGKMPVAHRSIDNEELNRGRMKTFSVMASIIEKVNENKCKEDCHFIINGALHFLEQSYIAYLIVALKMNRTQSFETTKSSIAWWQKNRYGIYHFSDINQDGTSTTPYNINHPILQRGSTFIDDMKIFEFKKFFQDDYYSARPMEYDEFDILIKKDATMKSWAKYHRFIFLPFPSTPIVKTASGKKVNIYDKSQIHLLGENARRVDVLSERLAERAMFTTLMEAKSRQTLLNFEKNKRTSDMTRKNIAEILRFVRADNEMRQDIDLSNKMSNFLEEWNKWSSEFQERWERGEGNAREMATTAIKDGKQLENFYRRSLTILLDVKKTIREPEGFKALARKKKGGRRTRKKRGSSRAEVCSQLLQRLKMINDQIKLGGFDINELEEDGKNTLKILKKCVKDGTIDIREYMKIKMEYENYFKQY